MTNGMNAIYQQSGWSEQERETLLLEQLPQVKYIARRIHERLPQHVALEDLVHSGVVGLIDALNKFDACKHVQFASYAKHRIRERSWTVCENWIGGRGSCDVRRACWTRHMPSSIRRWDGRRRNRKSRMPWG